MASKQRLRHHFLANVGHPIESGELRNVAGILGWARRVRELKEREGYCILTHADRHDLKPGQYLLLDPKPQPAFEASISKETRALILGDKNLNCQMCGAEAGDDDPYDTGLKTRLHIDIVDKSYGGADELSNVRALCSACHEGMENLTLKQPPLVKLKTQVQRARRDDQLAILKWLSKKYQPPK